VEQESESVRRCELTRIRGEESASRGKRESEKGHIRTKPREEKWTIILARGVERGERASLTRTNACQS
jgi:hypothetical protein